MKIMTQGKYIWTRTIGSTLFGQGVDTISFFIIASALGVFPWDIFWSLVVTNYVFKVGIEVVLTPLTLVVIRALKRVENEDVFDYQTSFNPFRLDT
jgi:uncharacterized integral membrane protein (TIGR00697 family)